MMAQILSESHSIKSLYYLDIAHRLEFVRLMMQRLQCNAFMLSYRGYAISYFYYICTVQTCSSQYFVGSNILIFFICDTSKPDFLCRYGESDGYPSQKGITYDAQVC